MSKESWMLEREARRIYNKQKKNGTLSNMVTKIAKKQDKCPVCNEEYNTRCKCMISERTCSLGHKWILCSLHKKRILLKDGQRSHNGLKIDCNNKCT